MVTAGWRYGGSAPRKIRRGRAFPDSARWAAVSPGPSGRSRCGPGPARGRDRRWRGRRGRHMIAQASCCSWPRPPARREGGTASQIAAAARAQAPCPAARSAATCAGVQSAWLVRSSVASVTGAPLDSTICNASGSFQALNSADAVTLPSASAPVISTISASLPASAGSVASSRPRLVAGPRPTSVTDAGAASCKVSRSTSTARPDSAGQPSGSSKPPRPLSPCTWAASSNRPSSGRSAPATTGTGWPLSETMARALASVRSSPTLPPTTLTSRTSSSGEASASHSAMASSVPGSQSMMVGRGGIGGVRSG